MESFGYKEGTRRLSRIMTLQALEELTPQPEYDHLARVLAQRLAVQQGRAA